MGETGGLMGRKKPRQVSERPRSRRVRVLAELWPFLRPYRGQIVLAAVALSAAAGTVLAMGKGLQVLVDGGLSAGDGVLAGFLGVVLLLALSSYARFYYVSWVGERLVADLRQAVFRHVLRLSPAFFEVTRTGEVLSRLTTDTTLLQAVISATASTALRNLLLLFGGAVLLLFTSAKLTALVAIVVPAVLVPVLFLGRRVRRLSRESQDRVADVGAYIEETIGAIRTVQAFGREVEDNRRFSDTVESAFDVARVRIRARAWLTALVMVLAFGSIGLILWIGARDMAAGSISPGELSAFVFYAVVLAAAAAALSAVWGELQRAAGATERLLDLLRSAPEIVAPEEATRLPTPPRGEIRFEKVIFHYPAGHDRSALDGFSATVSPGERVAIVGPSGAGKTTVFQLLLRFFDPQEGRVTFDGVPLAEADPEALRARIGLVPQEPVIFSTTARENIRYGRPEASDAEVRRAAEVAHATEFLDLLPHGLDTYLGEKGVRLSGGQRQRVAIARAVLRDPPVLLLDEATSSLDAESERSVQQALEGLMEGRTTIVIAHRLATVLKADRILVMDEGRVVEAGTHEELVGKGGLYARLAALQFDSEAAAEIPRDERSAAVIRAGSA
jgi:ATP-binding cassette subfamily B protein